MHEDGDGVFSNVDYKLSRLDIGTDVGSVEDMMAVYKRSQVIGSKI